MPTVLITGANRGLGLEFARQYADADWTVIATCRNPIGVGELGTLQGNIEVYGLDVTDARSISRFGDDLGGRPIDVLINNAGVFGPRGVTASNIEAREWMSVLETNTMAPLFLAQALIENVAKSTQKKIVNISSIMGSVEMASGSEYIYRSSKAALNMAMACFAADVRPRNVIVALYHPGWVKTDMGTDAADLTPETSVGGMRTSIDQLSIADTGAFLNYDGAPLPW